MKTVFKRWAIAAVVIPAVAWGLSAAAKEVAARRGNDSKAARGLSFGSRVLRSK